MWIIVGTTLTLAGAFVGLVSYRVFMFQINPEYKFKFERPVVSREVDTLRIGFAIRNDALFPISVEIDELRTLCSTRTTQPNRVLLGTRMVLAPGQNTFYHDATISIGDVQDTVMVGRLEVSISYGHPEKLSCNMKHDLDLFIPLNPSLDCTWANHIPMDSFSRGI